jgi:UDP-N-acetylglucosamine--N-acetylmuramyl-(pentapeptide) pyrophosphoryl-undecaprenol N-acetylglucosamine transferase
MALSVLIAGGGTGGHLYPGIAVARALLALAPGATVAFVGTAAGLEARVIPKEGFELDVIRSAGLKGKSTGELLRGLALLPVSAWDAWQVISRRRPSIVVGVGGYSSGPVLALAALRGIPTLLMEQNALPGFTNRVLTRLVGAAAVTYEESVHVFGAKAFVAGNPVRPTFFEEPEQEPEGSFDVAQPRPTRVLVFGGSQGAHAINVAMVEAAARIASAAPNLALTHQTGARDLEMVREGYRRAGQQTRVEAFLFEMDREMKAADLVVCRAGATTLAELTAAGRPSILIPLPTASDDHQRKNAQAMLSAGASLVLDQRDLTGERLAQAILDLVAQPEQRGQMSLAARRLAKPDAARVIAKRIVEMAR